MERRISSPSKSFSEPSSSPRHGITRGHSSPLLSSMDREDESPKKPFPRTNATSWLSMKTFMICIIVIGSISGWLAYWNIFWSSNLENITVFDRASSIDFSRDWLLSQWASIVEREKGLEKSPKPLVEFTNERHVIDPTRPILTASLSSKSIETFDAFSTSTDINVWDLYPPHATCPDIIRLGSAGDGGKWICGLDWLVGRGVVHELSSSTSTVLSGQDIAFGSEGSPVNPIFRTTGHTGRSRPCVMYSFGVNDDVTFEVEVHQKTGCEVHAFDPTAGKLPFIPDWPASRRNGRIPGVTFHKVALGSETGPNAYHSLAMTLQDIMHQLNHSFVDVLKVDIEGGEWRVFDTILQPVLTAVTGKHASRRCAEDEMRRMRCPHHNASKLAMMPLATHGSEQGWSLPFGQLLIELHYASMKKVDRFFQGMLHAGFLTVSREINLIPTMSGGKPLAAEYSFINPQLYYVSNNPQFPAHLQSRPKPQTPSFHEPIRALIYFLTQKKRLYMMQGALELLYENYWLDYARYPVVIFHDDLGPIEQRYLQKSTPLMKLHFITIQFSLPKHLDASRIPNRTVCDPKASSIGYRHMCWFHSTMVHGLLLANGYGNVEYIMRLDDDSKIVQPIGYDMFRYMKVNKKLYGFVRTIQDPPECVIGLWNLAGVFLNRTVERMNINRTEVFFDKWPNGLVVFNNFEISHFSIWKNPVWQAFMAEVEESGGIYMHRWGDAPIHTIGISLILRVDQVHSFSDIAYFHNWVNQTAKGLPPPKADPFSTVSCIFYDRWVCDGNSTNSTANATYALSPAWSGTSRFFYSRIGVSPVAPLNQPIRLSEYIKGSQRAVLYSFAHIGREEAIAKTLINIYESFTKQFQYPIVVFHSNAASPSFDVQRVVEIIGREVAITVRFFPVNLLPYQKLLSPRVLWPNISKYKCVASNPEIFGAMKFLQFDAARHLGFMGYDWFFRFGDTSRLTTPVTYDWFASMAAESKVYGFLMSYVESSNCATGAWDTLIRLCQHSSSATTGGDGISSGCGDLSTKWLKGVFMLTSFEIMHHSVLRHPLCEQLRHTMESSTGIEGQVWTDGLVHTLCIVASLSSNQVKKFDNVHYDFGFAKDTSAVSAVVNRSAAFVMKPAPELDKLFMPRRLGWLAGDVAASFALPSADEIRFSTSESRVRAQKYIWLFGDSLIGTSLPERRLEGVLVSNSIGVASMVYERDDSSRIASLPIYWAFAADGAPKAIFSTSLLTVTNYQGSRSGDSLPSASAVYNATETSKVGYTDESNGAQRRYGSRHHRQRERIGDSHHRHSRRLTSNRFQGEYMLDSSPVLWPSSGISIVRRSAVSAKVMNPTDAFDTSRRDRDQSDAPAVQVLVVVQLVQNMVAPSDITTGSAVAALSFREFSSAFIVVQNPFEPPSSWDYDERLIIPTPRKGTYKWLAVVVEKGREFAYDDEILHVIGQYKPQTVDFREADVAGLGFDVFGLTSVDSYMVVSRISARAALSGDLNALEVACHGVNVSLQWTSLARCSSPWKLFAPVVTEPSVHWDATRNEWILVSLEVNERNVRMCRAPMIAGPWSCALVADVGSHPVWGSENYILYGAKAHPELRRQGDAAGGSSLILSYIPNAAQGPTVLYTEANNAAYTPKFIILRAKSD